MICYHISSIATQSEEYSASLPQDRAIFDGAKYTALWFRSDNMMAEVFASIIHPALLLAVFSISGICSWAKHDPYKKRASTRADSMPMGGRTWTQCWKDGRVIALKLRPDVSGCRDGVRGLPLRSQKNNHQFKQDNLITFQRTSAWDNRHLSL
jgi:hypothetical protein